MKLELDLSMYIEKFAFDLGGSVELNLAVVESITILY
jgi:hypothetical protein